MKFMLLIHGDESKMNAVPVVGSTGMSEEFTAYHQSMVKAGIVLGGERLRPTTTATSVRVRDGKTEILDGPYAETKEQFGGYYLIEAADLDEATQWAARCPSARGGTVEVRPVWPTGAQ